MSGGPGGFLRARLAALGSLRRVVLFASVGTVGAAVDTLVLIGLVEVVGLGPVIAKVFSWEAGIAVIFVLNERVTFAGHGGDGRRAMGRRYLRSNGVRLGGLGVTLVVLAVLVYGFDVWYVAANVVGIGAGFFVNYTFESLYTWKVHRS